MAKKRKTKRGSLEKEKFLLELGAKYAKELTERATVPELEFKQILDKSGVEYQFQVPIVCERNFLYILDFYLPKYKIVFEIDGWQHDTKEGIKEDKIRTRKLNKLGIAVKRVKNFNVKLVTPEVIKNCILHQTGVKIK